jgi:signal transduction histidine kinase
MLFQAVANLVDNAIKHAPEAGGSRSLAPRTGELRSSSPTTAGARGGAGEGARAVLSSRRSRTTPGAGLGLSLVSAVVARHGGELRLEDNEPGLRAVLTLPR